ncbi:MAG: transferase hexapeptide repeat family protein [Alphaproteobacteria bacterium]|nr:transferase hexapeptide repeat family protein [Alphaproteobacteria bacterium]
MKVYAINGVIPVIEPGAFVHPDAVLIGDVIVEAGCYIGPCASLRGDFGRIIVRKGSNVQDSCILHSLPGFDAVIGANGHIGHGAVIHSAQLADNVLVGMNAVVMDHARIGESAIIAAMSFVKAGSEIPARHLAAGVPARVVRELSDKELAMKIEGTRKYQELAQRSLATLQRSEPLSCFDSTRPRVDADISLPARNQLDRDKGLID